MKIQLLIAAAESDYSEYLSNTLSTRHADTFAVGLCSSYERLGDVLTARKYDVVLIEPEWIPFLHKQKVKLPLALYSEHAAFPDSAQDVIKVRKYQRISTLVSDILEHYANVAPGFGDFGKDRGQIVAVWSPAGGVGKTTVALAYATRIVSGGSAVTYLDLEHFSSSDAYFPREGKSISSLFEKLESNAEILVRSIRQHDSSSGIDYFCPPNNFDDLNELTTQDMVTLATTCASTSDVVVVDLSSSCDNRTKAVLDLADLVLLVTDGSKTTTSKLNIFTSQHSVFEDIRYKTRLVTNKGAMLTDARFETTIRLPNVQSGDPGIVFKTLSGNSFDG